MSQQQPSYPQLSYGQPMNYTTQPMYSPAEKMSTTPVDPLNAAGKPRGSDGQREFATGLCGACGSETGTCLASCLLCCAPCIHANSKHRYNALSSTNIPATSNGYCTGPCFVYSLLACFGVGCFLDCGLRGDLRRRYNIKGGGCGDCCASTCCLPCNQAQIRYEIRMEEQARENNPSQNY